jgi:hypothetical protein
VANRPVVCSTVFSGESPETAKQEGALSDRRDV